jgi:cytochrome c oxidase assembly protein Cox11
MKKRKSIKALQKRCPIIGSSLLFTLLCFLFSVNIPAQLFQSDGTSLFISKETILSQNISSKDSEQENSISSETEIYIIQGTKTVGLESCTNVNIALIQRVQPQEKQLANHVTGKEQRHPAKNAQENTESKHEKQPVYKPSETSDVSFVNAKSNTCVTTTTVNSHHKTSTGSESRILTIFFIDKNTATIDKNTEIKNTFLNYSFTIRPPPFI